MNFFSAAFLMRFGDFVHKVTSGEYRYAEDVALALDELAVAAWKEVRELYPPSHVIEGEIIDDRPSSHK